MNFLSYFITVEETGASWFLREPSLLGIYNLLHGAHNSKGDGLLCLSDHVTESSASPTGTCSCLSVQQDEQCPAHQMVICSTSHLCCIPDSLQPRTVSSIRAARQLLPITLPNGSSQKSWAAQTGWLLHLQQLLAKRCFSFCLHSWLHQSLLARRMV